MWTPSTISNISTGVGFLKSYTDAQTQKASGRIRSKRLLAQARAAESQGAQKARNIAQQGKQIMGQAVTGFAAQGAVADPKMLAKLKMKTDDAAMQSIFDSRMRAIDLRLESKLSRISGQSAARQTMYGATSNLMSNWRATKKNVLPDEKQINYYKTAMNQMKTGRHTGRGF